MIKIDSSNRLHTIIMILCFVYGGISLLFFLLQMQPLLGSGEVRPPFTERINLSGERSVLGEVPLQQNERRMAFESRVRTFLYEVLGISLFGSVTSILAGVSLLVLVRKKEHKELTSTLLQSMTTPEEQQLLQELSHAGGELTQSELVIRTGLNKVRIHRVLKRLEQTQFIRKYPYGMTNKIRLVQRPGDVPVLQK